MNIIIILIITALVAIYIALPFFLRRKELNTLPTESKFVREDPIIENLKNLGNQKENLYTAIKDIEFDYGLGKLSKEDYEELSVKYKNEAASVLKQIDEIERQSGIKSLDQELEQEILSYRKSNLTTDEDIEKEISAFRAVSPNKNNCSQCGSQYSIEDLFCSKCGAKLK